MSDNNEKVLNIASKGNKVGGVQENMKTSPLTDSLTPILESFADQLKERDKSDDPKVLYGTQVSITPKVMAFKITANTDEDKDPEETKLYNILYSYNPGLSTKFLPIASTFKRGKDGIYENITNMEIEELQTALKKIGGAQYDKDAHNDLSNFSHFVKSVFSISFGEEKYMNAWSQIDEKITEKIVQKLLKHNDEDDIKTIVNSISDGIVLLYGAYTSAQLQNDFMQDLSDALDTNTSKENKDKGEQGKTKKNFFADLLAAGEFHDIANKIALPELNLTNFWHLSPDYWSSQNNILDNISLFLERRYFKMAFNELEASYSSLLLTNYEVSAIMPNKDIVTTEIANISPNYELGYKLSQAVKSSTNKAFAALTTDVSKMKKRLPKLLDESGQIIPRSLSIYLQTFNALNYGLVQVIKENFQVSSLNLDENMPAAQKKQMYQKAYLKLFSQKPVQNALKGFVDGALKNYVVLLESDADIYMFDKKYSDTFKAKVEQISKQLSSELKPEQYVLIKDDIVALLQKNTILLKNWQEVYYVSASSNAHPVEDGTRAWVSSGYNANISFKDYVSIVEESVKSNKEITAFRQAFLKKNQNNSNNATVVDYSKMQLKHQTAALFGWGVRLAEDKEANAGQGNADDDTKQYRLRPYLLPMAFFLQNNDKPKALFPRIGKNHKISLAYKIQVLMDKIDVAKKAENKEQELKSIKEDVVKLFDAIDKYNESFKNMIYNNIGKYELLSEIEEAVSPDKVKEILQKNIFFKSAIEAPSVRPVYEIIGAKGEITQKVLENKNVNEYAKVGKDDPFVVLSSVSAANFIKAASTAIQNIKYSNVKYGRALAKIKQDNIAKTSYCCYRKTTVDANQKKSVELIPLRFYARNTEKDEALQSLLDNSITVKPLDDKMKDEIFKTYSVSKANTPYAKATQFLSGLMQQSNSAPVIENENDESEIDQEIQEQEQILEQESELIQNKNSEKVAEIEENEQQVDKELDEASKEAPKKESQIDRAQEQTETTKKDEATSSEKVTQEQNIFDTIAPDEVTDQSEQDIQKENIEKEDVQSAATKKETDASEKQHDKQDEVAPDKQEETMPAEDENIFEDDAFLDQDDIAANFFDFGGEPLGEDPSESEGQNMAPKM